MTTPECYNDEVLCGDQCVLDNRCCLPEFGWLCPEGLACFTIGAVVDCYDTKLAIPTSSQPDYSNVPTGECTDPGLYEYCSDAGASSYYSTVPFISTVVGSSLLGVSEPSALTSTEYPLSTSSEVPFSNSFETFVATSSGASLSTLLWIPLTTQSESSLLILPGTTSTTTPTSSFSKVLEQPHLTPSEAFSTYPAPIPTLTEPILLISGGSSLSTLSESPSTTQIGYPLTISQSSPTIPFTLSLLTLSEKLHPTAPKNVSSYTSGHSVSLTSLSQKLTQPTTFSPTSPESPSTTPSTTSSVNVFQTPITTSPPLQASGPSKGVVTGIVLGVIGAAAIFAILGFMLGRRKRIKKGIDMVTVPFENAQYRERPIFSYVPIREEDHNPNFSNQPEEQPFFQSVPPGGYPDQHYYN